MSWPNKAKSIELCGGYRVRVTFADGFVGEVDLQPLWANPCGPLAEPFRDPAFFQQAFLDHGALTWPNSYDICPDVLRHYCEVGRVTSDAEMNAHFNPETAAATLHDKPKS